MAWKKERQEGTMSQPPRKRQKLEIVEDPETLAQSLEDAI
jgi:hypothetical protein